MCLVVFSFERNSERPLVLAGNRDEFYSRETAKAGFWVDIPGLLAGRDLKAGGTWLGINQDADFAFLTNFRHPKYFVESERSRGELLTEFFTSKGNSEGFKEFLISGADKYNGYNLIFGNPFKSVFYFSNVSREFRELDNGIYGISNAYLETPWPKLLKTKEAFENYLSKNDPEPDFRILTDTDYAERDQLPDTGVGIEMEEKLSAPFIRMENYGTRCSTFISVMKSGDIRFDERTFQGNPEIFSDSSFRFRL